MPAAVRILRFSRVVADLPRAVAFYCDALGFHRVPAEHHPLGIAGAMFAAAELQLGRERVALVQCEPTGAPYPAGSRSDDRWFQHLAIVVSDMDAAFRHLSAYAFTAISSNGPERLPQRDGGVMAFKFRDPDGHPLELLWFPPGQGRGVWQQRGSGPFRGIDHSALSVGATAASLRYYRDLGFTVAATSCNYGAEQERLDAVPGALVDVTSLRLRDADGPGLELLGYRPPGRADPQRAVNDIATGWVTVLATGLPGGRPALLRDPDGHLLWLVADDHGAT